MSVDYIFAPAEPENSESRVVVHYAADEIKGFFTDVFGHGKFRNYRVLEYSWHRPTNKTHAIVIHVWTRMISEWAMDVVTRQPYRVRLIGCANRRSRNSRNDDLDLAVARAARSWHER